MEEKTRTYHNVHEWSIEDVSKWLKEKKFDFSIIDKFSMHKIDGKVLLTLTEVDLKKTPLAIQILGDIKKLHLYICQLQTINVTFYSQMPSVCFNSKNIGFLSLKEQLKAELSSNQQFANLKKRSNFKIEDEIETDISTIPEEMSEIETNDFHLLKMPNGKYQEFKPEAWKALVAMAYFFAVTWITAIVMVIVHDRVPDMQTYPPLPDIFLDNVPLIPWAFAMCELCGLILFIIMILLFIFHKHRFILLRRMFSLFGSVFFLRCVTMLITSLSVPGRHLKCKARPNGNWLDKISQAYLIWQGAGMSIQGVRTCGDYMFSGHTVVLTLLNFFITEYTPRNLYFVHTLSWVLNLFGVFFILAGHEHYSIDVFIAFYISTRLFLYYHTLANNRALYQGDRKRTRIWFPLFYFFESGVNGIIPNQFEIPFKSILIKFRKLERFRYKQETKELFFEEISFKNKNKLNELSDNLNNKSIGSKSSKSSKKKNKKKNI